VVRATRNPYYWKIDTEFNQLPYIDTVAYQIVADRSEIFPLVLAGEIDMQDRNISSEVVLPENQAQGGYSVYQITPSFANYMAIMFNQTVDDPVKREIFQNFDFRVALSHAINRPALIASSGLDVEPAQVSPLAGSPLYSEQASTQYTTYDVELANTLLDEAGYSQRDDAGFRLGPDGNRIQFTLLYVTPTLPLFDTYLPQIEADWEAVGIMVDIETVDRQAGEQRWIQSDFDVTVWPGEGGIDTLLSPRLYVPISPYMSYAPRWAKWYINPNDLDAEQPPESIQNIQGFYRQITQTTDIDEQFALMDQIITVSNDSFYVIGIHALPITYGVLHHNFYNVPNFMFAGSIYPNPAPTNPSQYFIDPQDD
jgi:peptide/nickel transport system substrate-binding protein